MRNLSFSLLVLLPFAAFAGPPFFTDDPEPVELHHWELYLASQLFYGGGDVSGTLPHFEVNYGGAPELQLHAILPLGIDHLSGGATRMGPGDIELGAKYRFVHEGDLLPQIGTFPLVELPTGDSERGLGAGGTQIFLPIWLQKSFGDWTTYGGAGYWVSFVPGGQSSWTFGWELQRKLSDNFTAGAEIVHHTASAPGGEGDSRFNLGLMIDLGALHHVLLSWGHTFTGPSEMQTYAAYQLTFGPE